MTAKDSDQHPWMQLLTAARAGDPEALERLLGSMRPFLTGLVSRIPSRGDSSDVIQEALLEISRSVRDDFRGETDAQLKAWATVVLTHNAADIRKAARRQKRGGGKVRSLESLARDELPADPLAGSQSTPSAGAMRSEERRRITKALASLPSDEQRRVVELRFWERLSFVEIGQRLGCSAKTAERQFQRAIARLSEQL